MSPNLIALARTWLSCFAARDVDALVALYSEEATHTSPKLRAHRGVGQLQGRAALRAWWADAFERLPELRYVETTLTAGEDRVFMEYVRKVPGEPDLLVAEVLEVRDGLITASRVYHG